MSQMTKEEARIVVKRDFGDNFAVIERGGKCCVGQLEDGPFPMFFILAKADNWEMAIHLAFEELINE